MFDSWVIWLVLGLVLMLAELAVPGVILVFFGLGAVFTAILTGLGLLPELGAQLAVFAVSSVAMLLVLRRIFRRTFSGKIDDEALLDEFIGREVVVVSAIPTNGEGRVEINGSNWRARSHTELRSGSRARIIRREGLLVWLEPIEAR